MAKVSFELGKVLLFVITHCARIQNFVRKLKSLSKSIENQVHCAFFLENW